MESCWRLFCVKIPQRWVFAVMGSLGVMNAYAMRICLSLTIIEMVMPTHTSSNRTGSDLTCPTSESTLPGLSRGGTYEWDEYTQGVILSSFFWGYIITQIPGGILAAKFGGKQVLGLGIFSTAIFTLVTPTVVKAYEAVGLIVIRVLMGFGEGTTYPAVAALIAQWAPPNERSRITTMVFSGGQMGTILGTALSGVVIRYSSTGWSMVFYVFGVLGILWYLAWILLCYSHPDVHPFISQKEKNYLHETMNEHTHRKPSPTPWRQMLTSVPLWASLAAKFGREWAFQTMVNDLPKYMSNVLKFSIQTNGLLMVLPNMAMSITGIAASWLTDWSIKNNKISRTNARKTFTTISSIGSAVFMVIASYVGCNHVAAVILFTASMGMIGPSYSGIILNPLDLSPNHSATLMALLNVMSSLCGILAPYTIGLLTPNQALLEWRTAFWITLIISCVSTLIFIFWGDGEVQYWNDLESWVNKRKQLELKERVLFLEKSTEAGQT